MTTIRQLYTEAQRERTRARKQRDRLGRNQTEYWMLKREETIWTTVIMWISTYIKYKEAGL